MEAAEIRRAREADPDSRERDFAARQGISEAQYVAAWCGRGTRRVRPDLDAILPAMEKVREVMALTRNESAVHEKIGVYDRYIPGNGASMMLGEKIDLRMFTAHWKHAFAVTKGEGGDARTSLQFFDRYGEAVHKIHLRPASDREAFDTIVDAIVHADQSDEIEVFVSPPKTRQRKAMAELPLDELRRRWSAMTDTHQFAGILRELGMHRYDAVSMVGEDYAWAVEPSSVPLMMERAAAAQTQLMCFVGNRGCIQIHSGPIKAIRTMGPWLNVMDPDFHLHLRTDHIANAFVVRKPTDKGHVTSLEAYDAGGDLIIQFFGKRIEGQDERTDWRENAESLPRLTREHAA
jgi:putative hemin transport protein